MSSVFSLLGPEYGNTDDCVKMETNSIKKEPADWTLDDGFGFHGNRFGRDTGEDDATMMSRLESTGDSCTSRMCYPVDVKPLLDRYTSNCGPLVTQNLHKSSSRENSREHEQIEKDDDFNAGTNITVKTEPVDDIKETISGFEQWPPVIQDVIETERYDVKEEDGTFLLSVVQFTIMTKTQETTEESRDMQMTVSPTRVALSGDTPLNLSSVKRKSEDSSLGPSQPPCQHNSREDTSRFKHKGPLVKNEPLEHTSRSPSNISLSSVARFQDGLSSTELDNVPQSCHTSGRANALKSRHGSHEAIASQDALAKQTGKTPDNSQEASRTGLRSHRTTGRRNDIRHACDVCGKTFVKRYNLLRHSCVDGKKWVAKCDECGKQFTSKSALKTHSHVHADVKPFSCGICGQGFVSQKVLRLHGITHTGEQPFQCDVCQKRFSRKANMMRHVVTHSDVKSYKCDVCQMTFYSKAALELHFSSRHGEKKYECSKCGKKFGAKGRLTAHFATHALPYTCGICSKKFPSKIGLECHLSTHTGVKPHKCTYCDKSFAVKSQLTVHVRKAHT